MNRSTIEADMHSAAKSQLDRFTALAMDVDGTISTISAHTSKSIKLPVVEIATDECRFVLRDNFHDINLYCERAEPIVVPLASVYPSHDLAWYREQIDRKRNYSFLGWTDEEMDDARILRVFVPSVNGGRWSVVSPAEKDRWLARETDPAWYGHDWSSGTLIREGDVFYEGRTAFAEGMAHLYQYQPYTPQSCRFICAVQSIDMAKAIMIAVKKNC